jgi:hypothetical protein
VTAIISSGPVAPAPRPLVQLVGFECGVHFGPPIVHATKPGEAFGVTLDGAMEMIDEFAEPGRTLLLDLRAALDRLAKAHQLSPLLYREASVSWRFNHRSQEKGGAS